MAIDTVISEVRWAREELAKRFNYNLQELVRDARERQASGGRKVVSLPPRQARKAIRPPSPNQAPEATAPVPAAKVI